MGKKVNVVLWDGRVVSVDEDVAAQLRPQDARLEGVAGESERARQHSNEEAASGLQSLVEGGLDAITLGGYGALVNTLGTDHNKATMKNSAEHKPGHRLAGQVLGTLAPTGILGGTAKAATSLTGVGVATRIGAKGTTGARLAEGAILAGGARIAETNISGDPLSVEGLVQDMTIGAVLNLGFNKIADQFSKVGAKPKLNAQDELTGLPGKAVTGRGDTPLANAARARQGAEEAVFAEASARETAKAASLEAGDQATNAAAAQNVKAIEQARKQAAGELKQARMMLDESPAYTNFRDSYNATRKSIGDANTVVRAEVKEYAKFATPAGVDKVLKGYEKVQAVLRERAARAAKGVVSVEGEADAAVLAEMQDAIAGINKLKTTVKSAIKDDQYELAATAIGSIEAKIAKLAPEIPLPVIPKLPGQLREIGPELPKKLTELGGKRADSIAKLAGSVDDMSKAELDKLAAELGLAPGETAVDTLSTINKTLRENFYVPPRKAAGLPPNIEFRKLDDVLDDSDELFKELAEDTSHAKWKAASADVDAARAGGNVEELDPSWLASDKVSGGAPKARGSILDGPINAAKRGAVWGISRLADTGGIKGAIFRTMVGGGAGYALDGVQGAVVGTGLINGRLAVRGRVREMFSKFARPAESTLRALGPISMVAKTTFPWGLADDAEDDRQLAKNRINDVLSAVQTAPDTVFELVRPMMHLPGDVAFQVHQKIVNGLRYLGEMAPKDPQIDVTAMGSGWDPSYEQADEFLHRYEAVMNPNAYLVRVLAGDGHPSGMEALAINWSHTLQEALNEAAMQDWSDLTLEQHRGLSMLYGRPMSAMQHPEIVMMLQGMHLPREQQQAQQSGGGTGNPTGRPPAVQSKVAGSNVASLTA